MVWGLVEPGSFGDFFLDGNYVGWEEGLKHYFDNNMNAHQREKFGNRHVSYVSFIARKFSKNLGLLEAYEIPNVYRLNQKCKFPASMIKLESKLIAVDEDLKKIIENLEPNIHKFSPISIFDDSGKNLTRKYYSLIIQNFLDAFISDKSEAYISDDGLPFYYAVDNTKKTYSKICISNDVSRGRHLWRDVKLSFPSIFISDEMQEIISEKSLRIFKYHGMKGE